MLGPSTQRAFYADRPHRMFCRTVVLPHWLRLHRRNRCATQCSQSESFASACGGNGYLGTRDASTQKRCVFRAVNITVRPYAQCHCIAMALQSKSHGVMERERYQLVVALGERAEGQRMREVVDREAERADKPVTAWARETLLTAAGDSKNSIDPVVEVRLLGTQMTTVILRGIAAMQTGWGHHVRALL